MAADGQHDHGWKFSLMGRELKMCEGTEFPDFIHENSLASRAIRSARS
jgi:hypothetical protein